MLKVPDGMTQTCNAGQLNDTSEERFSKVAKEKKNTTEKEALAQEKRKREARSKPADKDKKKQASRELKAARKKA